jgi:divalent metal cation (Fe/Co/Zn/Cd) transporter
VEPISFSQEEQSEAKDQAVQKSTWVSVCVNLLLTAMQVVAGMVTGLLTLHEVVA